MGEQGAALNLGVRPDIERYGGRLRAGAAMALLSPLLEKRHVKAGGFKLRQQGLPAAIVNLCNSVQFRHLPGGSGLGIGLYVASGKNHDVGLFDPSGNDPAKDLNKLIGFVVPQGSGGAKVPTGLALGPNHTLLIDSTGSDAYNQTL